MGRKVVFLDIDGTILDHEKKIPNRTKEAIQKLQSNNIIVSIATGRAPFMFQDILKELHINSYICLNGQFAVYEGNVIHENPIEKDVLEELTKYSLEKKHPLVYMSAESMKSNVDDHPYIKAGMDSLKISYPLTESAYYKEHPILQVLLFNEAQEQLEYEKQFEKLRFVRWHEFSCDVMPSNGSKAHGIEKFIEKTGLQWEDTYGFGDGLNDLEMLEKVHTGVAMGNSVEEVKEIADYITDDVAEDGLSKAMKHLGLIDG